MKINLSETQKKIVEHGEGALLVEAGPGTGKTRVLTERVRRLLKDGDGHFRVLALTFTNRAANEMKDRLAEYQDITQRAFIGTLHSFCLQILSSKGQPVGIEGQPNIFESEKDRAQVLLMALRDDPALCKVLRKLPALIDVARSKTRTTHLQFSLWGCHQLCVFLLCHLFPHFL